MCHPSSLRYKQQKAVFKLLGAHGYPEKGHYMDELRERARAFCRAQGCAAPMQREIHEMVHEDMHASYGWYRIFPQRGERHPHVGSFRSTPQYANLLTPLDHLMQKWVEQGWEPAHTHDRNNSVIVGGGGGGGGGGGRSSGSRGWHRCSVQQTLVTFAHRRMRLIRARPARAPSRTTVTLVEG